jgi:hypothetical protein
MGADSLFNQGQRDFFAAALAVKAFSVVLNTRTIQATLDGTQFGSEVHPKGGKVSTADVQISMKVEDWQAASGKKGDVITFGGRSVRVRNDPDVSEPIVRLDCASASDQR